MKVHLIIKAYTEKYKEHKKKETALDERIDLRKAQIDRLEKRLKKLRSKFPYWTKHIVKPIADEMIKSYPDRYYDILGPFGLGARTSIHFYKKGTENKFDDCLSITFEPGDLKNGDLFVIDYSTNTGEYKQGTNGEINGFNYPRVKIPEDADIGWLIKFMSDK